MKNIGNEKFHIEELNGHAYLLFYYKNKFEVYTSITPND